MGAVTISLFCVIHFCIIHYVIPKFVLYWKVCYLYFLFRSYSSAAPELYIHFYWYICSSYNSVCIDMFVYVIQYNCSLYFILIIFSYISPFYELFFQFIAVIFTIVLYFCECYIYVYWNMLVYFIQSATCLYSNLGKISCIFPVYDFLWHCHHHHWPALTKVYEHLFVWFSCHMHWNIYTSSKFLNISYISFCYKVFCCLLLLGQIFTLIIQHSNRCNQNHIYTIFKKISSFCGSSLSTFRYNEWH